MCCGSLLRGVNRGPFAGFFHSGRSYSGYAAGDTFRVSSSWALISNLFRKLLLCFRCRQLRAHGQDRHLGLAHDFLRYGTKDHVAPTGKSMSRDYNQIDFVVVHGVQICSAAEPWTTICRNFTSVGTRLVSIPSSRRLASLRRVDANSRTSFQSQVPRPAAH